MSPSKRGSLTLICAICECILDGYSGSLLGKLYTAFLSIAHYKKWLTCLYCFYPEVKYISDRVIVIIKGV